MNISELPTFLQLDLINELGDDRSRLVCKSWKSIFETHLFDATGKSLLQHIEALRDFAFADRGDRRGNYRELLVAIGFHYLGGTVYSKIQQLQLQYLQPDYQAIILNDNSSAEEKKDPIRALFTIEQSNHENPQIDPSFLVDKTFFRFAVKSNNYTFSYADKTLKMDKELILECAHNSFPFQFIDESLKGDVEFGRNLIEKFPRSIRSFRPNLLEDLDFYKAILRKDSECYHYMGDIFEKYPEFAIEMINEFPRGLLMLPAALKTNKDFVLKAVGSNGMLLQHNAIYTLKNDLDINLAAVRQNPEAYQFVPDALKQNPEILQAAGLIN